MKETELCDLVPRIRIALVHSKKKAIRYFEKLGIPVDIEGSSDAKTIAAQNGDFGVSIVLMQADGDIEQQIALLAHEAVHVADWYFDCIGETFPSSEFRAYVTQAVTQYLVYEHLKWRKKHCR